MKRVAIKLNILLFVMTSLLFFSINTNAATIIGYDEYSTAIIDEYARYGVELEMKPLDNGYVYTKELLNKELLKVEENVRKIKESRVVISSGLGSSEGGNISEYSMYGNKNCSAQKTITDISNPLYPCYCQILIKAKVRVDYQNNHVIKGYRPTLSAQSAVVFDDYVKLLSYKATVNNSSKKSKKHYINYSLKVELKKSISIGGVQAWQKESHTTSAKMYPFK